MSEYLKIVFRNQEPVRIADDSTSQSGQTVTLRYIPGTALRGVVINALARETDFESVKKNLFSTKIRFLNAYLTDGEKELIPSPKGFYEDKLQQQRKKEIDNVVARGEPGAGKKRASLGRFCYMEQDCICYYHVDTSSDLKIKINDEKQNVFRHEYVCAGYVFTGYIAVEDKTLKDRIKNVFAGEFVLGNARSSGLGKCHVICCEYIDRLPYEEYLMDRDLETGCYMMLLSNTVMRDANGELCGLDCDSIAGKLGVTDLRIESCATSTVEVKGYNRKWGTKIPSALMYEQGSIFYLKYSGILTTEKMKMLCDQGIGIRLNEGFGRVLFLKEYENIKYKKEQKVERKTDAATVKQHEEDQDTLMAAAGCYYRKLLDRKMNAYVVKNPLAKGEISNSQLGILESFTTAYKYEPMEAKKVIDQYLEHALDKEMNNSVQKERRSIQELRKCVQHIFDTELDILLSVETKHKECVMGVPKSELFTDEENLRLKLELITKLIRYDNKKEEV